MDFPIFNSEMPSTGIASCDERLSSIQRTLDSWKPYLLAMKIAEEICDTESEKATFRDTPHHVLIKNCENNIRLVNVEKLMYYALEKDNRVIFPRLLAKYDELMVVSYDLSGNMVNSGLVPENEHLDWCKASLKQREYIKTMCEFGERRG